MLQTRIIDFLSRRLMILAVIACILTIVGFGGQFLWLFDLASHFRLQYLLIQTLAFVWLLFAMRPKRAVAMFLFAGLNLWQVLPYYLPDNHNASISQATDARVLILQMNVWEANHNAQKVASYIAQVNPDLLSLEEYKSHWPYDLTQTGILKRFPYHQHYSDIALYSRYPLRNNRIIRGKKLRDSTIISEVLVGGQQVTVIVAHTKTPLLPSFFNRQLQEFSHIADFFDHHHPERFILLGDLNTTPWSYPYREFIRRTGLKDTQKGLGLMPSWPSLLFLPWIPIDHCLVSDGFVTLKRQVGPFVGSDHYPVTIELGLLSTNTSSSRLKAAR